MPTATHEQTINTALGEILDSLGKRWRVRAENIGGVFEGSGRPDILIEEPGGWPLVIEAEVDNHRQAEKEATSRLGRRLSANPKTIETAVALVYPAALRNKQGAVLRDALRTTTLEYAVLSGASSDEKQRFPAKGWLRGSVEELAILAHRVSVSVSRVEALATELERGINRAEGAFSDRHESGSSVGARVASVLAQSDDVAGQSRRMAMTVLVNALVFQAALAEAGMAVKDPTNGKRRPVRSPGEFRSRAVFTPTTLQDEWFAILEVNYWPIFHTAGAILGILPTQTAVSILGVLWESAEQLIAGGVTKSHDLTGTVFQRLIADRKFLATYYTRPSAAALLVALALPLNSQLSGLTWGDARSLATLRIGDFACGTGTLLSSAYNRVSLLHEIHQGNAKELHPTMMRDGLVGLDVLNIAVHLTAAMLAGTHPDTPFDGECLLTMPYGVHEWGVSVGSLSLLERQESLDFMKAAARTAGGKGEKLVRNLLKRVDHGSFNLVVMNPPFTRHGAREGDRTDVHNPAFAAFEANDEVQNKLSDELKRLSVGGCAHGHAGLASYFVELVDRKLAPNGTVALVLPLSAMSGVSWERVRLLWRKSYHDIRVVTIAGQGTHERSFSEDTGMAECMVIAKKGKPTTKARRAIFAVLSAQPTTALEGETLGHAINAVLESGGLRKLEDGPFGGSRISLGATDMGEAIDCPLPEEGSWTLVGIKSIDLAQTAHQLTSGLLWVEGMSKTRAVVLPVTKIEDIIERIGPHDLDLTGAAVKSDGLPQGPFEKFDGCSAGDAYPFLWSHDAKRERHLIVAPDSHGRLRKVTNSVTSKLQERADERWQTAARAHYNRDLQFNSQSLVIAMTEKPSLGGRAWPTVVLKESAHEFAFALWCNSTLGILCHWWGSNKTQAGRGSATVERLPMIYTLDVRALSDDQHKAAKSAFQSLKSKRFLPFDQIDEDDSRAELDRILLVDILGVDADLCRIDGPMAKLRSKLASEPQINGGKQTRVVFGIAGEERAEPRSDRS